MEVFQEGRVYALSSGHKVHFERLKRHVNSPAEWKANLMEEEVKVHFDPNPEESVEEVDHDVMDDSFFEETPHSEDEVEHQGVTPQGERREIQTRTRTALDEGRERKYFTQYGYSSSSDEEPVTQDQMLPRPPDTPTDRVPPEEQVLSDILDFRAQTDPEDQLEEAPNLLDWDTPSPGELKIDTSPEEQISIGEPGPSRPRERTPTPPRKIPSPNKVRTRRRARDEETNSGPSLTPEPTVHETKSPELLGKGRRKKAIPQRYLPTPSPMPAKRGRPPDVCTRQPPASTSVPPTTEQEPIPMPRRGPGRPRKVPVHPQPTVHTSSVPQRRKPGRPPKKKTDQQSSAAPQPAPRRNRPQRRAEFPPPIATQNPVTTRDSDGTHSEGSSGRPRRRIHKPKKYCPCCNLKRIHCQRQAPTLLTRTHEIMRLEGTPINMARGVDLVRELNVFKIHAKPAIASLIVKTHPIYASTWKRSNLDEILDKMEKTNIEDVENVKFLEWTRDGCSLEFSVNVVIPFLGESIEIAELDSGIRYSMVSCIDHESLREEGRNMEPGEVVFCELNSWKLVVATSKSEKVKPETLMICIRNLLEQCQPDTHLALHAQEWHRGQFKFQDWYELWSVLLRESRCTLTIIPTRVHQCPSNLDKALKLIDEWIHLHAENQRRKEDIWKQRGEILAYRDQKNEEPTVGRMLIFRNSAKRPEYSDLIWFDESDFSQQYGNIVIAMPADLQPKSAVARAILREHDPESIFKMKPRVGHMLHLNPRFTGIPGHNIFLLFTRASSRDVVLTEDWIQSLMELANLFHEDNPGVIRMLTIDAERGVNNLASLYSTLDDVFRDTYASVVLHDRVFVAIA